MVGTLSRVRVIERYPGGSDGLLASVLAVIALIQAVAAPIASLPVGIAIALLTTVPVAWRRSHPAAAAIVSSSAGLIPSDGYVYVGYVVAFIVFYSASAYIDSLRDVAWVVAAGVVLLVAGSIVHGAVFGEYFGAFSAVLGPALVGRVVRTHRAQNRRLEQLTAQIEREREQRIASAIGEERARIARELHDVIAHEVSVIAIQADAAEAALDRDSELARAPLEVIRGSALDALGEMRRLLGMLRDDGDDGQTAPPPSLAQLPALVDRARGLGIETDLEIVGSPVPVSASVEVSAFRIGRRPSPTFTGTRAVPRPRCGWSGASTTCVWRSATAAATCPRVPIRVATAWWGCVSAPACTAGSSTRGRPPGADSRWWRCCPTGNADDHRSFGGRSGSGARGLPAGVGAG